MPFSWIRRHAAATINAAVLGAATLVLILDARPASAQLTFNLIEKPGITTQAVAGFEEAAALWSSRFSDSITINLEIGFQSLSPGVLAQAGSTDATYSFSNVRAALDADRTSADDNTAVANLPGGSTFDLLINRTSDNPNGSGSATPYLDNNLTDIDGDGRLNNNTIRLNNANAKALGLLSPTNAALDASITFNSDFGFDFDRSDGITAGQFDFVGIAAHEIGHSLGFVSGVDVLDNNSPPIRGPFFADQFIFVTSLDLFRYSNLSAQTGGGVIDFTADNRDKFFSIDGGVNDINGGAKDVIFSTGPNFGDGQQASHWKDNLNIGIMDPTVAPGEFLSITTNDERAFDVIGYNLAAVAAPEPSTFALLAMTGGGGMGIVRLRRRKRGDTE